MTAFSPSYEIHSIMMTVGRALVAFDRQTRLAASSIMLDQASANIIGRWKNSIAASLSDRERDVRPRAASQGKRDERLLFQMLVPSF
jgi:hypothetical protein